MRGPYTKTIQQPSTNGTATKYRKSTWYRTDLGQKVRTPLPYTATDCSLIGGKTKTDGTYSYDAVSAPIRQYLDLSWGRSNVYGNSIEALHNKCYAKFLEKVRSSPQIGTDIAEYRQTFKMIEGVLRGLKNPLTNFAKAHARYKTGITKQTLKDIPNVWLPWHFGVEPLIKDLHDLCERLADPGKPRLVSASKSQTLTYTYKSAYGQSQSETYKQHVRMAGFVTRVDENLSLYNDCGLVNPASIAWELVPYSFVVDWFYPVGSYINSITDLLGYTIQNPYRTWFVTAEGSITLSYPAVMKNDPTNGVPVIHQGFRMDRALVAPAMVAQKIRIPTSLSVTRAATQISLLLQILMKHR